MEEITFNLNKDEVEHLIRAMHNTWDEYGLCRTGIEALIKLEMSIGITKTRDYIKDLDDGLLTDEMG